MARKSATHFWLSVRRAKIQINFCPSYFYLLLFCLFAAGKLGECCSQQYKRELRYLDYYLGIAPANEEGSLVTNEVFIDKYVENSASLNCDLKKPCLWTNAPTDNLLDTSDFYLFNKTDSKSFPIQIRPGNASPKLGELFMFAGNKTNEAQGAVLLSSPILCQSSLGLLTFEYWLYNTARVEILLARVNADRGHLQVISRPPADCHFLKTSPYCRVEIPTQVEPFRIGIRAFALRDTNVGSFAMLNHIKYEAEVCGAYDKPSLFAGVPINKWLRQRRPIVTAADLNCGSEGIVEDCLWAAAGGTGSPTNTQWSTGHNMRLWNEVVRTPTHPVGQFIFQTIDPMAKFPLPELRSVLVPCTQTPSSLSFKFWLSPGVQAQLCTLSTEHVALSCVYLNEFDSPGPVMIDVDTADHQPFRFAFSVIKFHPSVGGVIAIDDIVFKGYLCHEKMPPSSTPKPIGLEALFELQPFPESQYSFSETLDCDFETDFCSHWMHNQESSSALQFSYGFVPQGIPFKLNPEFKGQVAIALLPANQNSVNFAMLTSQMISCSENGKLTILYFTSEGASLSICADDRCVSQKKPYGEMTVTLSSQKPFRIRILGSRIQSDSPKEQPVYPTPFLLIKRIKADQGFCRLETPTELACKALTCSFKREGLCNYTSVLLTNKDTSFQHQQNLGLEALFSADITRAILRSPDFSLSSAAELRLEATLTTFGSTLYICPDEQQQRRSPTGGLEIENCELLLGPKVEHKRAERILVQLDPDVRHFVLVAVHDKFDQFGEGRVVLNKVQITDSNGDLIC